MWITLKTDVPHLGAKGARVQVGSDLGKALIRQDRAEPYEPPRPVVQKALFIVLDDPRADEPAEVPLTTSELRAKLKNLDVHVPLRATRKELLEAWEKAKKPESEG